MFYGENISKGKQKENPKTEIPLSPVHQTIVQGSYFDQRGLNVEGPQSIIGQDANSSILAGSISRSRKRKMGMAENGIRQVE